MINDLVTVRLLLLSLWNATPFILFVLLATPIVSFFIGAANLCLALKNAVTIQSSSTVLRQGSVGLLGRAAVPQYLSKHQILPIGNVYTHGFDYKLEKRLSYY